MSKTLSRYKQYDFYGQSFETEQWGLIKVLDDKSLAVETVKLWIKTHPKMKFRLIEKITTEKEVEIK